MELSPGGRALMPYSGPAHLHREFSAVFAAVEWIGQKWGGWPASQDEFHTAIKDWLDFLHSINLLTDQQDTVYLKLLREANVFLPSSDGDMQLQIVEGFQYGLFALSSYRGSHAMKEFAANCAQDDADCFRAAWFQNRQILMDGFPRLLQWLNSDPQLWQTYATEIEVAGGAGSYLKQYMVFHYIETFLVLWDKNGDGLIDVPESLTAFQIYHPILGDLLAPIGFGPDDVEPLFTFLFKYGATPFTMFGGSIKYLYWKWHQDAWKYQADRKTLAGVLSELNKL